MKDIIVGKARIYFVDTGKQSGWVVHGGYVISNHEDAFKYAHKVNRLLEGKTNGRTSK